MASNNRYKYRLIRTNLRHPANVEPDKVTQEEHPAEGGGGGREDAEVKEEAVGVQGLYHLNLQTTLKLSFP